MGERTRNYNWSQTTLGTPDRWPQSLRTTLSIILHSKFPMFLFWGPELLCFYNDTYRPSLGNDGKHPFALGKPGSEVWPEIWPVIKPFIDQALSGGEATWSEDQLIPIYRNGKLEDVYWTFSYSPVSDESRQAAGVFVTCTETTGKVVNLKQLEESNHQLQFAIDAAEMATWDFNPITDTFTANQRYTEWFGIPAAQETANSLALRVIAAEDRERVIAAYKKTLVYGSGSLYDIEYTIRPKGLPERVLRAKGKAWFNEQKIAYRFNGTLQDVTKEAYARKELSNKQQTLELAIDIGELGVFTIDLRTNTATCSQQIMDWFGLAEEQLPLAEILSKIHPDDRAFTEETIERSVAKERNGRHDLTYRLISPKDKKLRHLRSIGQVQFEAGTPVSLSGIIQDVTEPVKARRALEESSQRFQQLIQDATVGIIVLTGAAMNVELVNEAYGRLIARTPAELTGRNLFDLIPDAEAYYRPFLDSVMQSSKPVYLYDSPYTVVTNGKQIKGFLNIVCQPYRNANSDVVGVMVLCSDVTDQVLSRKKLEQSEHRIRSLIESAPFPIGVYTGKEMKIELANRTMLDTWGKGDGVIGKLYSNVLPELDNQEIFEQLDGVFSTGIAFHAKNQRVDLVVDGTLQPFYFNYSFTPLFNASGAVYGVMNTAANVTDLNFTKQKVEESERNLRNMIVQAPVAMCILKGPEHIIEIANERMFELWGKPAEAAMHQPMFEAVPESSGQGFEALLQDVYKTGITFNDSEKEVRLFRNEKLETLYLNFAFEPLYEARGVISGIMAVAVEVTEQVLARRKIEEVVAQRTHELAAINETLSRTNHELARSNQNLEEFAYAASHDLKEPIRKIHFFTDRIKNSFKGRMTDADQQFFARMEVASRRMSSLIDDLLSYSQVNLRPRTFDDVDMNQLLDLVLSDLDLEIEEKGAVIHREKLFNIRGHHRQLQQAFQNLISNALKYNKPGVTPKIRIGCKKLRGNDTGLPLSADEQQQGYHLIQVTDNGIGFEQKDAERIFNVFTRLHGNTEFQGTGVGLSIVRKVIENHNGYIAAESEPGKGATFKIFLPA